MFTAPTPATGDWFVADPRGLAARPGTTDSTPEQAARLARVLTRLRSVTPTSASLQSRVGHAARLAAEAQVAVTPVTLGTTICGLVDTISAQPTADALRLLSRLLPTPSRRSGDPESAGEDPDLAPDVRWWADGVAGAWIQAPTCARRSRRRRRGRACNNGGVWCDRESDSARHRGVVAAGLAEGLVSVH